MELTLASAVCEKDYDIVLNTSYGKKLFKSAPEIKERLRIINNVKNRDIVQKLLNNSNLIDNYIFAEDKISEVMNFWFGKEFKKKYLNRRNTLKKILIQLLRKRKIHLIYNGLWYSTGPLTAIFYCNTDYLLYFTGDAYLSENENLEWISKSIELMEKSSKYIAANPIWNNCELDAKVESEFEESDFYVSSGFSDQCFLINARKIKETLGGKLFQEYNKVSESLYPVYGGRCFEAVFNAYMRNHGFKRLTYKYSHYIHEDFSECVRERYIKEVN